MAWYRAGTVAVTNGSAVVTGTGTAFVANVQQGHAINLPDGRAYEVLSINSDTQITLGAPYLGSTATGQTYSLQPNQGFAQAAATVLQGFLTQYGGYASTSLAGRFNDGSVANPGITFSGEQSTGWYRPGAGALALALSGAMAVTFGGAYTRFQNGSAFTDLSVGAGGITLATSVGNITHAAAGGQAHIWAVGGTQIAALATGGFYPLTDNAMSAGLASLRFSTFFAVTGTINTSDERTKQWRGSLTAGELAAAKDIAATIGIFQFNEAIADKGADHARLHTGVKAQQVISIMTGHGLDPMRYGFVCYDSWAASPAVAAVAAVAATEGHPAVPAQSGRLGVAAGDLYGIRYEELAMFLAAAQEQRIAALEAA